MTRQSDSPRLVIWLGSSIGNFHRDDVVPFLKQVRAKLRPTDRLLVGFDLRKEPAVLEAAYNDAAGVTEAFIRNLLTRMNRELGANFRVDEFVYRASFNAELGRVEMWLESPDAHTVTFSAMDWSVDFKRGEGIHMENSHKYSPEELAALAQPAGFELAQSWTDAQSLFCEALLVPRE